jgi:hypothetical protein
MTIEKIKELETKIEILERLMKEEIDFFGHATETTFKVWSTLVDTLRRNIRG